MADSILRLKVESQEYDNKLKQATNGLTRYIDECRKVGGTLEVVEKETLDYVRTLGQMDTTSRTATGKLAEMKKTFTELSAQYKQMTDAERQSPFGKALAASLDQLKTRTQDAKKNLADVQQELSGSKFGQFGSILDGIGQKMGLNANITELLTSKTALLSAGIGAAGAIVGKATQEWAKYNAELAKQDQITTVTTGLKGPDSDRMTDQARALTDTYGVDFREAINAANTLMTQFGQTGEQAMSLISDGMQGMIQGDGPKLLSMIQQYAPAFRDAGVTASQLVAVIQNSEGGIFTDQNMNAIVMGIKNIRLMTKATSDALAQLGIDGQKMSQQLSDGSLTIFDALKQVATQIQGVNSNSQAAGEVMQQVFGRQGAMAGTKLGEAIATLNTNLEETKRQTGEVGDAYNDLYNANVKLNGAIRDCFEYDGWEQMATGIKSSLVSALASVIEKLATIKQFLTGMSANDYLKQMGGSGKVGRMAANLAGASEQNRQSIYQQQQQEIWRYINRRENALQERDRWFKDMGNKELGEHLSREYKAFGTADRGEIQAQIDAAKKVMREYQQSAKKILQPIKQEIEPTVTDPKSGGTKGGKATTHTATPQERAASKVSEAERTYTETLLKNSIRLEAGIDSTLENKKKELSAQERLFDAYNDAYATYKDPKYKEASAAAAEKIKQLAAEVKTATDAQEAAKKSARELESAQKKLADAQQKLVDAQATGSATAIYKAKQNVDKQQANVDVMQGKIPTGYKAEVTVTASTQEALDKLREVEGVTIDPKTLTVTASTQEAIDKLREVEGVTIDPKTVKITPVTENLSQFDALKQSVQAEIKFDQMQVDENTLHTLLQTALKNGLEGLTVDYGGLQQKIAQGIDIPESTWQELQDEINEKLKGLGIDPIKIDFNTGGLNEAGKDAKTATKDFQQAASAIGSVGSALSSIEDPSAKVAGIVAQAIATVASAFAGALGTDQTTKSNIWAFIAAAAASTATMISTIASIHSATGYAQGGVIKGNSYSGDNIGGIVDGGAGGLVGLNAGEIVLNQAQTANVANALKGSGMRGIDLSASVSGEQILLVANRTTRRKGQGELVTWK